MDEDRYLTQALERVRLVLSDRALRHGHARSDGGRLAAAVSGPTAEPSRSTLRGERASWFQVAPLVLVLAAVLRPADAGGARRQLLRLRPHRHHPGLHLRQLRRAVPLGGDAAALSQLDQVRADRLGDDAACWASTSPISWCSTSAACCGRSACSCSARCRSWTSNIIRMISWIPFLGRNGIFNQALMGSGIVQPAAGVPAVLRLRRGRGLRPPVHAVHGGADLQFHGAHRHKPARGGARRRRQPLPGRVRDRAAAVARPASRWARSS